MNVNKLIHFAQIPTAPSAKRFLFAVGILCDSSSKSSFEGLVEASVTLPFL